MAPGQIPSIGSASLDAAAKLRRIVRPALRRGNRGLVRGAACVTPPRYTRRAIGGPWDAGVVTRDELAAMTDEEILAHYRRKHGNPYMPLSMAKEMRRADYRWLHSTFAWEKRQRDRP